MEYEWSIKKASDNLKIDCKYTTDVSGAIEI